MGLARRLRGMSIRVGTAILLVVALTLVPAGTAATASVAPDVVVHGTSEGVHGGDNLANTGENTLTRTTTFALRPSDPGRIRAEMAFAIPDQVVELTTAVPDEASVVDRDGFRAAGDGNYSWDEETARPSITLSLQVNRTGTYHQRPAATGEPGLMFADTGDWAIASVPSAPIWWSSLRSEPPVSFARETAVDDAGVAGDRMAYLGPHDSRTRTIDGQEITLVVPEAASLEAAPEAIFDTLSTAASGLPASQVPESLVIAAPTAVDWGPYGLADGSDTWVRADQPLDDPGNVWVHEFVHLRQDFRTTAETRWIREGMPEYYAALFTLEAGHIDFDEFVTHLDRGTRARYDDTVLADPDSWTGLANYAKGALVYGDLDRQIRTASDGGAAALQVFDAMNEHEGPIDQAFLASHIRAVSDAETASAFEEATTTTVTPTPWSLEAHRDAFGTAPPKLTTAVTDPIRVTGPYRNVSGETIPTLVPGETLTFPVTVQNEGDVAGEFDVQLEGDGRTLDSANGSLDGGARTTIDLTHQVSALGQERYTIGNEAWTVVVAEPTAPVATDLSAERTGVAVGETVQVTAQFENTASVPANGSVDLMVNDVAVSTWPMRLDIGETQTRTAVVEIGETGDNRIVVRNQTLTVEGTAPETSTTSTATTGPPSGTTSTQTPGFGGLQASIAFFVVVTLFVWRRR